MGLLLQLLLLCLVAAASSLLLNPLQVHLVSQFYKCSKDLPLLSDLICSIAYLLRVFFLCAWL